MLDCLKDTLPQFSGQCEDCTKGLYGLLQVPCTWYSDLHNKLRELGMVVSHEDLSPFVLQAIDGLVLALIYVNDCLIAAQYHSLPLFCKPYLTSRR